jgi:dienelactone hydrolase
VTSQAPRLLGPQDLPAGHPGHQVLSGHSPLVACQSDQRVSSCAYIPDSAPDVGAPLLVAVHSTGRDVHGVRDQWVDWAERHGWVILAPLFPGAIGDPNDLNNYKLLAYNGIRFDELLLAMLDEAAQRWRLDVGRFALYGFFGGDQFVHRFAYLHPDRLLAACVAAPGSATLPGSPLPWPQGTGDMKAVFGTAPRLDRLRRVPIRVLVGELDTDLATMDPRTAPGEHRVFQARALTDALVQVGVTAQLEIVPSVAHESDAFSDAAEAFFTQHIGER